MRRDEGSAAWYRKRNQQPVPAISVPSGTHSAASGRQPKFVTPDGTSVQAISLDGRAQYQIMSGKYLVAYARDITEVAQYVDLAELEQETAP